mmetsp:Transcript_5674/g.12881  ORF Transcript_5674/g.12881 Transcript_5674/m.12881 type:complete len:97 (-) Transcript_5674:276-566(-)
MKSVETLRPRESATTAIELTLSLVVSSPFARKDETAFGEVVGALLSMDEIHLGHSGEVWFQLSPVVSFLLISNSFMVYEHSGSRCTVDQGEGGHRE